ncbi:hypothetical protein HG536_0H04380 [Torulaspora globosa]|uniref:Lysophospholipase n=1 Tax=Torulaspora globosa TaxID=48254 RepID=A0A7G3ZNH6_9SACH|nr:uncharacterized protein HG536_0H04380 [Torulaspora globosa]QLL35062.1 hypothetical protein HG536_0H04380 [Torulaspora globosa]
MTLARLSALAYILSVCAATAATLQSSPYAPVEVSCDTSIQLVRKADGLSQNETEWLGKRDNHTKEALKTFLEGATSSYSNNSLIARLFSDDSNVPRVAVACSGGGYRAMLSGAGMLAAMDDRTEGANEHGLGGLLQATTYLAGLSGGSWLVGSLAYNNWTSVQEIIDHTSEATSIWNITASLASLGGINSSLTNETWSTIMSDVDSKQQAGYVVTITDYWGRALSYGFFPNAADGGVASQWSSLRDNDIFRDGEMPFPISVADFRSPNTATTYSNSTIFEFNPFEMGSWDESLHAFTDLKYLGTNVFNGVPVTKGRCVTGFDNVGFVIGTSSSLFSPMMSPAIGILLNEGPLATIFTKAMGNDSNDVANYSPNPFRGIDLGSSGLEIFSSDDYLFLADGGEDGETIPLAPLLQKDREVDVIFAFDNSADTTHGWPNGSALVNTYKRQFTPQGRGMPFPHIPSPEEFVQLHLNERPVFFGCDANSLSDLEHVPPLVIYVPNAHYSFNSNQSTFKLAYDERERLGLIRNGFEAMTRRNLTEDVSFPGCVACAIMRRQQERLDEPLPEECSKCFANYCWDNIASNVTGNGWSNSSYFLSSTSGSTITLAPTSSTGLLSSSSASFTRTTSIHQNAARRSEQTTYNIRPLIVMVCLLIVVSCNV